MSKELSLSSSTSSSDAEREDKAKQRQYERQSRERRKSKIAAMRARVEALECVLANVMFVRESDDVWDEFRGDDASRVRQYLRRSYVLTREARRLSDANAELSRMLHEHCLASDVVGRLMRGVQVDKWSCLRERWAASLRASFSPWTPVACRRLAQHTVAEISAIPWSTLPPSSKLYCMGWEGMRRYDEATTSVQFSFSKTLVENATWRIQQAWMQHTDADTYQRVVLGPNCKAHMDILQRVTPDAFIVHVVEQRPASRNKIHAVNLVSRFNTDDAIIQMVRSIATPAMQLCIDDDDSVWANHYFCAVYDEFELCPRTREITKFRLSITGSVSSFSVAYADLALTGMIVSLVRADTEARTRPLLKAT